MAASTPLHDEQHASPWVVRWSHLVPPRASVLDVACGSGRHLRWFAARGHAVTGIDRDAAALQPLQSVARTIVADIENGPWPLPGAVFDAVVVTRYLWRALMPTIVASVAPGGVLIYETFADGQQTIGSPKNPDFLLQPGELLRATAALRTIAYEDVFEPEPACYLQRIAAVREAQHDALPPRYPAWPGGPEAAG